MSGDSMFALKGISANLSGLVICSLDSVDTNPSAGMQDRFGPQMGFMVCLEGSEGLHLLTLALPEWAEMRGES